MAAIVAKKTTYPAADAGLPPAGDMGAAPETPGSFTYDIASIGGAKVGDTVSFVVDSIDEEAGTATLTPAGGGGEEMPESTEPPESAMSKAAGLFEEGGE